MHRHGFAALLLIPVSAIGLLRGTDVHLHAPEQTKALDTPSVVTISINTTVDGSEEEDHEDSQAWRSGQPLAYSFSNRSLPHGAGYVMPPKCPADVSETSPYMTENVLPNKYHTICNYRQPCDRRGTNLERLQSIRGLLQQTKKLLNGLAVPYAVYGGSAIGQQRCGDVLPWDSDCDVIVWEHDAHKITAGDIDSKYTVLHTQGNSAIPFVVADKTTGFYCDIFFMKQDPELPTANMAWPWGASYCHDMSTQWPFNNELKKCDKFPMDVVSPFVPCFLNGIEHTCFNDQAGFLELKFGSAVLDSPNVTTQPGGGKRSLL